MSVSFVFGCAYLEKTISIVHNSTNAFLVRFASPSPPPSAYPPTVFITGYTASPPVAGDEEAPVFSPSWLGAFTVSAYDEVVTVPFEIAALVDGEAGPRSKGGLRSLKGPGRSGVAGDVGSGGGRKAEREREGAGSKQRRRRLGLTSPVARAVGSAYGTGKRGGELEGTREGEARVEDEGGTGDLDGVLAWERGLESTGDGCEVTVCAAAAVIPLRRTSEEGEEGGRGDERDEPSVCLTVTVKAGRGAAAVGGVLELPDRPQVRVVLYLSWMTDMLFVFRLFECADLIVAESGDFGDDVFWYAFFIVRTYIVLQDPGDVAVCARRGLSCFFCFCFLFAFVSLLIDSFSSQNL